VPNSTRGPADHTPTAEIHSLLLSWRRHITAQRMSHATLSTYSTSVGQLAAFLVENSLPTSPGAIRREHVEAFISELLVRWKPATAHNATGRWRRSSGGSPTRARSSTHRWLG